MADTPEEFGQKMKAMTQGLITESGRILTAAAKEASAAMLDIARAARTKGITVQSKVDDQGTGKTQATIGYGPNAGWVAMLDNGTKAHTILPGKSRQAATHLGHGKSLLGALMALGRTASGGGASVLNIGGGIGPKASAHHPGSHGKHFVRAGMDAAKPILTRQWQDGMKQEMGRHFA